MKVVMMGLGQAVEILLPKIFIAGFLWHQHWFWVVHNHQTSQRDTITGLSANITPLALTLTGITAANKNSALLLRAALTGTPSLSGVISPDVVTVSGTPVASFATKTVGNGKPVNVTGYTRKVLMLGNYSVSTVRRDDSQHNSASLTITGCCCPK